MSFLVLLLVSLENVVPISLKTTFEGRLEDYKLQRRTSSRVVLRRKTLHTKLLDNQASGQKKLVEIGTSSLSA